jgi:hypothetical protein
MNKTKNTNSIKTVRNILQGGRKHGMRSLAVGSTVAPEL